MKLKQRRAFRRCDECGRSFMLPKDPDVAGNDVGGIVTCVRCVGMSPRETIEANKIAKKEAVELRRMEAEGADE